MANSIDEEMKARKAEILEKVKIFREKFNERIEDISKAVPEDYSSLVHEKIEAGKGVSYSSLKRFRDSPLSYIEYLMTPFQRTPAMLLGSVVDDLVTNKEKFWENWFIIPEKPNLRTNAGKAEMELYREIAGNAEVIEEELFNEAVIISEALYKNEKVRYYLEKVEKTQEWISFTHKETGLKVRGIIDFESYKDQDEYKHFIADLKTARSAKDEDFIRDGAKLWYNGQVGIYTLAKKAVSFEFPDFYHIVVETKSPYNTNVLKSDRKYIDVCQMEVHNTLMAFKYCLDNNLWHQSYEFVRNQAMMHGNMVLPAYYRSPYLTSEQLDYSKNK